MIENIPLHVFRMGITFIMNLDGIGISYLRLCQMFIQVQKKLNSSFPFRVRNILVVNPGWFMRVGISMAKVAGLNVKIIKRIQAVTEEDLLEFVDADNLITEYGGNIDFSYDSWLESEMRLLDDATSQSSEEQKLDDASY